MCVTASSSGGAGPAGPASHVRASNTISGSEYVDVMTLVARNHEGERTYADRLAARRTAPAPRFGVERAQEGQRRRARRAQFSDEIGERPAVEFCNRHVRVLIEPG